MKSSLGALPVKDSCSVELPAGTGKTELIARLAERQAEQGKRTLILTHTHAGVDAIRSRLKRFGVASSSVTVRTIAAWAFTVVRSFPMLSGLEVGRVPDWKELGTYMEACERASRTGAMRRMLCASYELLIVDEYQDCVTHQHSLVLALSESLQTAVLGDPMQSLLGFEEAGIPDWESVVVPAFLPVNIEVHPWRWAESNPELGEWLLSAREKLRVGQSIRLSDSPVNWVDATGGAGKIKNQTTACLSTRRGTVVALGRFEHDCVAVSSRLRGRFRMMEEIEGRFLLRYAGTLDDGTAPEIARATLEFGLACIAGIASGFPTAKRERLGRGEAIVARKDELKASHQALSEILSTPSPSVIRNALDQILKVKGGRVHRSEALRGVMAALQQCEVEGDSTVREAVVGVRNQIRGSGRRIDPQVVARPLLVKGLEYDHAILLDADLYAEVPELYVALTRGRKSVTVISRSEKIGARLAPAVEDHPSS